VGVPKGRGTSGILPRDRLEVTRRKFKNVIGVKANGLARAGNGAPAIRIASRTDWKKKILPCKGGGGRGVLIFHSVGGFFDASARISSDFMIKGRRGVKNRKSEKMGATLRESYSKKGASERIWSMEICF